MIHTLLEASVSAHLSLARAALRLSLTYHQVRALVLKGELRGGQDDNGRFYVEAADLDRHIARRSGTARSSGKADTHRTSGGR